MKRFVLLFHEVPASFERASHFDLMFEDDDGLRTWAIDEIPSPNRSLKARLLPIHRSAYLTYEGPVSGDRGCVSRVDSGAYETKHDSPARLVLTVVGERLSGDIELFCPDTSRENCWQLIYLPVAQND